MKRFAALFVLPMLALGGCQAPPGEAPPPDGEAPPPAEEASTTESPTLEALAGREWVLRSWASDEVAPAEPEITLQYVEGRFAGRSACNRYFAPVKETEPGVLEVGMGAGTRMACPGPAGAMESRFLKLLGGVNGFGFVAGQLMLSYTGDDGAGVMLFDGRPPGSPDGS